MTAIIESHWSLILAIFISLILISLFIYLKSSKPSLLEIESKWLFLSMIPILMALLTGGYIYKFKGFGIEIETSLKEPIGGKIELKAKEVMVGEISDIKSTLQKLDEMSTDKKRSIERLSFKNEYPNYSGDAVSEYLMQLPNLEYIELLGTDLKFLGVMLANDLNGKEDEFVQSLKKGTVLVEFSHFVITDFVNEDTNAIDALSSIRRTNKKYLPLLDKYGSMKGVVTEIALEKSITDEVLRASR